MVKTILIWGYLGSGKTTLINRLLQTVFKDVKTVIIENEFGEAGIDSQFLKSNNYQVKEINAGCICCSLRTELPQLMKEVEEINPEVILIEPSGISSLEDLIRIMNGKIDQVISLVDAGRFHLLMKLNRPFFERQFKLSPLILLTKTENMPDEDSFRLMDELNTINPHASVFRDYKELEHFLLTTIKAEKSKPAFLYTPDNIKQDNYQSLTFPSPILTGETEIKPFLEELLAPEYGTIFRIKGFIRVLSVQIYKIDAVMDTISVEKINTVPSKKAMNICFIGLNPDKEAIGNYIQKETSRFIRVGYEKLEILSKEIYSYLGSTPDNANPYFETVIHQQLSEIKQLGGLCFGYRFIEGDIHGKADIYLENESFSPGRIITSCLSGSELFIIMVATVGKEVELWMNEKHQKGDVVEVFIADAIGSALVEAIVSYALNYMEAETQISGYTITNSYSPGYCGWNVTAQQQLFSLLPPGFCGVSLTESSLMLPIKSVSAIIGVGYSLERKPYGCAICKKTDCYKRNL